MLGTNKGTNLEHHPNAGACWGCQPKPSSARKHHSSHGLLRIAHDCLNLLRGLGFRGFRG